MQVQQSRAEKMIQPTLPCWELSHQSYQRQATSPGNSPRQATASGNSATRATTDRQQAPLHCLEVQVKGRTYHCAQSPEDSEAHPLDKLPQTVLWSQVIGRGKKLQSLVLELWADALWSGLKFACIIHSEGTGPWLFSYDTDPQGFLPPHYDLFKNDFCHRSIETSKAFLQ